MAGKLQELIDAVHKLDELQGFRLVQASESDAADAVVTDAQAKAALEQGEEDTANLSEDEQLAIVKQLANDYTK